MLKEPLNCFVAHRALAGVNDTLQEEVGFLQLIPKERIDFGELKRWEIVLGKCLGTHYVQSRKQPATSGGLLVCDTLGIDFNGEMCIHARQIVLIECQFADIIVANSIAECFIRSCSLVTLLDLFKHTRANAPFSILCLQRKQCSTENNYR